MAYTDSVDLWKKQSDLLQTTAKKSRVSLTNVAKENLSSKADSASNTSFKQELNKATSNSTEKTATTEKTDYTKNRTDSSQKTEAKTESSSTQDSQATSKNEATKTDDVATADVKAEGKDLPKTDGKTTSKSDATADGTAEAGADGPATPAVSPTDVPTDAAPEITAEAQIMNFMASMNNLEALGTVQAAVTQTQQPAAVPTALVENAAINLAGETTSQQPTSIEALLTPVTASEEKSLLAMLPQNAITKDTQVAVNQTATEAVETALTEEIVPQTDLELAITTSQNPAQSSKAVVENPALAQVVVQTAATNNKAATTQATTQSQEELVAQLEELSDTLGGAKLTVTEASQEGNLFQQNLRDDRRQQLVQGQLTTRATPNNEEVPLETANQNFDELLGGQRTVSTQSNQPLFGVSNESTRLDAATQNIQRTQQTTQARTQDYNIGRQIVEQARLMQSRGNTEMTIKLNPEHLGQLSLKVAVNGNGGVTATFHSDNQTVRGNIENTMVMLKQELQDQGIKVDKIEVAAGMPDGQLPEHQFAGGQGQGGGQNTHRAADLASYEDDLEEVELVHADGTPRNLAPVTNTDEDGNITDGVDYKI